MPVATVNLNGIDPLTTIPSKEAQGDLKIHDPPALSPYRRLILDLIAVRAGEPSQRRLVTHAARRRHVFPLVVVG
ncbi:hypothetical protein [Actinomyces ruminis]|nr:hypothetical protein [Actinomyces ruminis]